LRCDLCCRSSLSLSLFLSRSLSLRFHFRSFLKYVITVSICY
jgi:hypothetical protein